MSYSYWERKTNQQQIFAFFIAKVVMSRLITFILSGPPGLATNNTCRCLAGNGLKASYTTSGCPAIEFRKQEIWQQFYQLEEEISSFSVDEIHRLQSPG